jgi:hypothetical protein
VWGEKKSLKLNKNAQEGEELLDSGSGGRWGKVWLQGNDKATRKQVAPLVVSQSDLRNIDADTCSETWLPSSYRRHVII